MTTTPDGVEALAIATIRGLALDGPHAARSGHQGTAMALAPVAHVLWNRVLRYDASDPQWPDRDRFILSAGHASILLYSMLYLTGHGLSLDDLRQFRQWGSATPGHPEASHTPGVEVTTGPLGQGIGNGVGMAMAEAHLRAEFGSEICDHAVWVLAGDGCLSEGISHESASLAGHLKLGRLNVIYDDNHITIDGPTSLALSDDTAARFRAYGWHVVEAGSVLDVDGIESALNEARANEDQPSLVIVHSEAGYPSPTWTGRHEAHGLPFDDAEIAATKAAMGLPDEPFHVPDDVLRLYRDAGTRQGDERSAWQQRLDGLDAAKREKWDAQQTQTGFDGFEDALPTFEVGPSVATRKASQEALRALDPVVPGLMVGSADLTGSNGVDLGTADTFAPGHYQGRQVYYGVREHAMGAAAVGMALHGGVIPVVATFMVFSDYMRPPVRLAALSEAKAIFVWSHDSIGVGEDGPTHQPVEQLMSLRAIPGLLVIRPADATETAGAWQVALEHDGPSAIILTRQNVETLAGTRTDLVADGAYAVIDTEQPDVILLSTGSEVQLCVEAAERLADDGFDVRVVSMPVWKLFDEHPDPESLLPANVPIVSVEAGVTSGWARWSDVALGIDRFGASAPASELFANYGITADAIVDAANEVIETLAD